MKKSIFLIWMAGATMAFGQQVTHVPGEVRFQNSETQKSGVSSHLVTNVNGTLLVGTQYKAELYFVDTATGVLTPLPLTMSSFRLIGTPNPGYWNGPALPVLLPDGVGGVDVFDDGTEVGDGSGTGAGYYPVTMDVKVWDSTFGSTYETAGVGPEGSSGLFSYTQRSSYPPVIIDSAMLTQPGFALLPSPVPEPSVLALSVIGLAGFLALRRRKNA